MVYKPFRQSQRIALTAQLLVERAEAVNQAATRIDIPRHRLMVEALAVGIPLIEARYACQAVQTAQTAATADKE